MSDLWLGHGEHGLGRQRCGNVKRSLGNEVKCFTAMIGYVHDATCGAQLFGEDFLVDEVIFHQKNVVRGSCEFSEGLWCV